MTLLTALEVLNYGLVLLFGLFLSVAIAGGWETPARKRLIFALCPVFLLVQGLCWLLWGVTAVRRLYPLIVHLPLTLILVFLLKKQPGPAVVSVCTAYLCCQLPRWFRLTLNALTGVPLAGELAYTLAIVPIFLLCRRFAPVAHDTMCYSHQAMLLFGSLPAAYYVFDYATAVYADVLHLVDPSVSELFPTAVIIFYALCLAAYHGQVRKQTQAELQRSLLEAELKQASVEMERLRRAETQTAIYQHDMRHHLNMLRGFLRSGAAEQAVQYIQKVQAGVDAVRPRRFCENETVNLLCSAFSDRAQQQDVSLKVEAVLPRTLPLPDTELCSLLSNGLENALHAAEGLEESRRWVSLWCGVRMNKLLIEIRNPFDGHVVLEDGLPTSDRTGHGYGCLSIRAIADHHRGLCVFESENGLFTLRLALPMTDAADGPQQQQKDEI